MFLLRNLVAGLVSFLFGILMLTALASAAACPNEVLRSELHSGALPDCRAYELVTPPYKEGVATLPFAVAEDGSHVVIGSLGVFDLDEGDGIDPAVEGAAYLLSRTPAGWGASPIEPPESSYQGGSASLLDVSTDFTSSLWALGTWEQVVGAVDFYRRESNGSFIEIGSPTATPGVSNQTQYHYLGASSDLSHVLFEPEPIEGLRWPFDNTVGSGTSLYEYVDTGNTTPSLVGVVGGAKSTELLSQCGTGLGSYGLFGERGSVYNAISASGTRIFFNAKGIDDEPCGGVEPSVDELLIREEPSPGQQVTVPISEPSTQSCPSSEPLSAQCRDTRFEGASKDGSKVFFTSTRALAEGASEDSERDDSAAKGCSETMPEKSGCNLYEDELSGSGSTLTQRLVTVSEGSADPRVQGVARISEDGSHIYFVARGVLTEAPNNRGVAATEGEDNLYVYERDERFPNGHTSFIATLAQEDESSDWSKIDSRAVQVSTEGRFLVFLSRRDLTGEGFEEGPEQVYQYDDQTGGLVRASIGQSGYNDNGRAPKYNATLPIGPEGSSLPHPYQRVDSPVATSGSLAPADGAVFFASPTALTPQALNNQMAGVNSEFVIPNIYEYDQGNIYLVSDGRDISVVHGPATGLIAASASGDDVFFTTSDPLILQDSDTQQDIYDARVDGGVAMPNSALSCAEKEECQGSLAASPVLPVPGSASQAPGGNLPLVPPATVKHKPTVKHKKVKPKSKKRRRGKSGKDKRAAATPRLRRGGGRR
jgi:hypothetical protein